MQLTAEIRTEHGKRPVRRLRNQGMIPGVIYGPEMEPVSIKLKKQEVEKFIHALSEAKPVTLRINVDGKTQDIEVFVKKVQIDKVTDEIVHIDFYKPAMGHVMRIEIPIRVVGKPIGVEKGGIMEVLHTELPVETLPGALVEHIEIDVSHLNLGESYHVRDLKLPEEMKVLLPADEALVTIIVPKGLQVEEVTAAAPAETIEPEVIKKGKKAEETEEEKE
ncbi:50S ribosomal protein L25 [Pseudothermotoga hypogea DSM 11164 = NBRC 106472]|uniref:Large ribosomal subunit protein bL25 n=1 Tax=Pseudothermotoga hypogea DSM 11164 = NBRC 106472 TaxID=1123384 RepID=A0A0X1KNT6_9THEM|nr:MULTISPECIES: 50S ribosomal protein L25 [Pseudothermotoga]AJC72923.1 50S ribosomal protein L25 [Pseudothermotoga hypogea DSM 11164 = NBRC 106472]MBC7123030.1 50S ribosomal protein L25 [Pseudothermotoga sp.]MDI6862689.1 50S ribosomal protein L25 [Pseudothermotoga sp.]